MNITKEKWNVNPDYGKENVYRVWDADSNYHDDTSPEAMDERAALIQAAPDLLAALKTIVDAWLSPKEKEALTYQMCEAARVAIAKAKEKRS